MPAILVDKTATPGSTCTTAVGTILAAARFPGSFTGDAGDAQTDIVTATAVDDDGTTVSDTDNPVDHDDAVDDHGQPAQDGCPSGGPGGPGRRTAGPRRAAAADRLAGRRWLRC